MWSNGCYNQVGAKAGCIGIILKIFGTINLYQLTLFCPYGSEHYADLTWYYWFSIQSTIQNEDCFEMGGDWISRFSPH